VHLERIDLLAYDNIYFYSVNGNTESFNIPLRLRNYHLSKEQIKSLYLPGDHIAYRFELLPESFSEFDQKDTLNFPFLQFLAFDH
jgi:hypothetical protein